MSALTEIVDRIERALTAHEITATSPDQRHGEVVRCACQPRDGPYMTRPQWRRHVAAEAAAKALRMY